jgi:outer membrane protein assembly factor BamD
VGNFYFKRGDNSAAANRLGHVVDQYPLYSKADLALWQMGDAYGKLGNRFRKQEGEAYAKIVRDYPLSEFADDATRKLKELEMAVPEPDKNALARMQYDRDHYQKPGMVSRTMLPLRRNPDTSMAAKNGDPAMENRRPSVPPLVPQPASATAGGTTDVVAEPVGNSSALDTKPDARTNPPAQGTAAPPAASTPAAGTPAAATPAAASTDPSQQTADAKKKKKNKKQQQNVAQPADAQPAAAQPATGQPASAPTTPPSN